VTEVKNRPSINIYPNPSEDNINFKFDQIPTRLAIYDVYGNLILTHLIADQFYKLNVRKFASGVYFYHATFEDAVAKGKLIVN
jgi:hypothetical protein